MTSEFYEQSQTINPDLLGDTVSPSGTDPVRDSAIVVKKKNKLTLKKKILFGAGAIFGLVVLVVLLVGVGIIPVPPDPDAHPVASLSAPGQGAPKILHPAVAPAHVETAPTESEQAQPADQNQTVMEDAPVEKSIGSSPGNGSQKKDDAPAAQATASATGGVAGTGQAAVNDAATGTLTARLEETNVRIAKIENQLTLLSSQLLSLKEDLKKANSNIRSVSPKPEPTSSQPSAPHANKPINNVKVPAVRAASGSGSQISGRSAIKRNGSDDLIGVITESKSSVDTSGKVQILGITSKAGGGYVVLSFAGIKKRYEKGESVPALGRITDFGSDSGIPYVEIAGVTYR